MSGVGKLSCALRRTLMDKLSLFRGSTWSFPLVLLLALLNSFAESVVHVTYTLLLADDPDLGMSDAAAGLSYGGWGAMQALFGIILSPLIDSLGVKKCLVAGFWLSAVGRAALGFAQRKLQLWLLVLGVLPLGSALAHTALFQGVLMHARVTPGRGFAYDVHRVVGSLGMLLNGLMIDVFRVGARRSFNKDLPFLGRGSPFDDGLRLYLLVGATSTLAGFCVVFFLKDLEPSTLDDDVLVGGGGPMLGGGGNKPTVWNKVLESFGLDGHFAKCAKVVSGLRKAGVGAILEYLTVLTVTMNMTQIFKHLEITMPKYMIRSFGCQANIGFIYSINPLVLLLFFPVFQALRKRLSHYMIIQLGGFIMAISPFLLLVFSQQWGMALFVVLSSIGEGIWLPAWRDYMISVLPKNGSAMSVALLFLPENLVRLAVGWLSGFIFSEWCPGHGGCSDDITPELGACHGRYIWGLVGLLVLTSPLGLSMGLRWRKSFV